MKFLKLIPLFFLSLVSLMNKENSEKKSDHTRNQSTLVLPENENCTGNGGGGL